jgi:AcrR family transcriptional regulator
MGRPIDQRRPEELLDAIHRYLLDHGLTDLSLRPLAKAVNSSPRGLLYHFGSKEKMVGQVLAHVRAQQRVSFEQIKESTFSEECWGVWKQMSSPESEPRFRLFFEVYGLSLRHPQLYQDFLNTTVQDWVSAIADPMEREGCDPGDSRALATLVLASLRGFMLDLCATHDHERLDRAVKLWLADLDEKLPRKKVE